MEKDKQFRKNFIWNLLGTGFNSFNSLFFMIIVTRINGVNDAGVFTIAFATATILYFIGVYSGRIYQVTEPNKAITNKEYIVNRIITTLCMLIFLTIYLLIRQYDTSKTTVFILLVIYKALESISDVLYGILQKNEKLEIVGKSLLVKSILSIICFAIVDLFTKNMILSINSMIFINIIIILFYDILKSKQYINFKDKVNISNIFKILKGGFFTFAIAFLGMYVLNAPKYSIDIYLENNYQTIFGIIIMPATVIGLIAQFLVNPYLNQIMSYCEKKDLKSLNKIVLKLILMIFVVGLISTILAYLLGTQILGLVYGIGLSPYKMGLAIIIISATLYTIGTIYSSVLTTVRKTFPQFIIYGIISIFAFIISNIGTKIWALDGAIIAYLMIMSLQFLMYFVYYKTNLKRILSNCNDLEKKNY